MQTSNEMLANERRIAQNRLAKCKKIVHKVIDEDVRLLESMTQEEWENLATQVGVPVPSQESQGLVVSMIKDLKGLVR